MVTSLLIGCGSNTKVVTREVVVDRGNTVCDVMKRPVGKHMNTVIDNGEKIIGIGAGEVVVTASELSDVYTTACK